jgi:hypothetical protein
LVVDRRLVQLAQRGDQAAFANIVHAVTYTLEGRRPIVLSLDSWTVALGEIDRDSLQAIVESLQVAE